MAIISLQTVQLNAQADSKEAAIRVAGELLVKGGHVAPAYVEGMLARERSMSTFIGNGVAIPHGQFEDRAIIYTTGISVAQFPQGILWNKEDGDVAYLVIGIAATSDEHVGILSNLAEALEDEDSAAALVHTTDPNVIIACLSRPQTETV